MARKAMDIFDRFEDLYRALEGNGAFLAAQDSGGKPNVMTIGWATLGVVWGRPILTVFVRPTRHTHGILEKARHFSVNVPVRKMTRELEFCGTRSGRDTDKIAECKIRTAPGSLADITILEDCDLAYECEIVQKTKVLEETLAPDIRKDFYGSGNLHTVCFGRVLRATRR